jgi:hypothetical protein
LEQSFTLPRSRSTSSRSGLAAAAQWGHWKSLNSTTASGAFGSPRTGQSSELTLLRFALSNPP